MPDRSRDLSDWEHHGTHIFVGAVSLPASTVGNSEFDQDDPLASVNAYHRFLRGWSQPNTAATSEVRTIHVARAAGTVNDFRAGSIGIAVGDSTVTVNLKKNGATILTGVVTLDETGEVSRVSVAGTISDADYVAGDWFEIEFVATAGTGTLPTGVYAQALFDEAPA